jgi:PiT family inorganic phosphate transporter
VEAALFLLILAAAAGLYMAWAIGANDVANAMGTSVGSGALTLKQAVVVAAVFEFSGALLAGGSVTKTVRKGIVDPAGFEGSPELFVYGMIGSLLAAAVWLSVASRLGWPVSTTHSIVGAIVGFSTVALGADAVSWGKVAQIVASWVTSPLAAGITAFVFFRFISVAILSAKDPLERTKQSGPVLVFFTTFILALVTLWKGLKHLSLDLSKVQSMGVAAVFAAIVAVLSYFLIQRVQADPEADANNRFAGVERIFAVLQIYTACAVAFAHGSNDVANAIGPMAGAVGVLRSGAMQTSSAVPIWMLLLGGVGIVVGLATYGYKVMATIGGKITELTPSRGYSAELSAAVTIVLASQLGFPISTTHTLVGAVLGVSLARGVAATNFGMIGQIVVSWVVTLPAGALGAIVFYSILKAVFGG